MEACEAHSGDVPCFGKNRRRALADVPTPAEAAPVLPTDSAAVALGAGRDAALLR